jgi:OPT oligopeptide transporter protein
LALLAEIYYFKPVSLQTTPLNDFLTLSQQTVLVSTMFLAIIAYVIGVFMAAVLPRNKYLNPVCHTVNVVFFLYPLFVYFLYQFPFNKKENAFIVIMASAAANSALGTEVLAVQRLYYNITPNPGASIFLLFSSQLLGYGIGGLFRCESFDNYNMVSLGLIYCSQPFYCTLPRCSTPAFCHSFQCLTHW